MMLHISSDEIFKIEDFPLRVTYVLQAPSMPPHCHDFIEIVLVGQGHSIHNISTKESGELSYGLLQGDMFSVMPGEIHKYSESKKLRLYNILFKKEIIAKETDELSKLNSWPVLLNPKPGITRNKMHLTLAEYLAAEKCLKKIMVELSLKKEGFKLSAKTALIEFLIIAARAMSIEWKTSTSSKNSGLLESITSMEKCSVQPFSLKSFAEIAGMSVSSYTKKFREATGLSPLDYFIGLRLEKVRWFLTETNLSISEIAFKSGFSDTNYMIKLFRIRQGTTPGKYRSLVRSYNMV